MSTKLRIGGVLASSIVFTTMIGVAPAYAKDCGKTSCRLGVESRSQSSSTSTKTSTSTDTTTTTRTRTRTTTNPLMGAATSKSGSSGGSGGGSAPKAAPLTAAQKAKIKYDNWREESFGHRIFGGCGDSDFPGVAAQCEEPETEPAAAPAQQASTRTITETETDTRTRTNTRRQRTVSTREIVDRAKNKIDFDDPDIGSAPCSDANCQGAVGVPVWLWTQDLPTQTASATAGGRSVRVKDEVTKVTWDLGDGTSVTCNGSGTSYDASMGWKTSPDCGVPGGYKKAGTYTVTATFHHRITWSGDASGSETAETTSSETVRIGEYQGIGVRAGGA